MDSRALNRLVSIRQRASGQDTIGQPSQTWNELRSAWANIWHGSGAEAIKADATASTVKASIRILRTAGVGVTAGMRVHHGSVIYDIRAVLPDEVSRDKVHLVCEVVDGNG
jgi:SPP1 family predicted phage head-tail adaptor